jgi:hypothetical protein
MSAHWWWLISHLLSMSALGGWTLPSLQHLPLHPVARNPARELAPATLTPAKRGRSFGSLGSDSLRRSLQPFMVDLCQMQEPHLSPTPAIPDNSILNWTRSVFTPLHLAMLPSHPLYAAHEVIHNALVTLPKTTSGRNYIENKIKVRTFTG